MWISWIGCKLGAQGSSLCGLSTYLLGLPHKMAVRFQKAATQEAYAANLWGLSTNIACAAFYSLKEIKDKPRFKGRELNTISIRKKIVKNCGRPNKQGQKSFIAKAKDSMLSKQCSCLPHLNCLWVTSNLHVCFCIDSSPSRPILLVLCVQCNPWFQTDIIIWALDFYWYLGVQISKAHMTQTKSSKMLHTF